MPTIQGFFDSDAFIRGLVGPYGSGKTSACIMELAQRGMRQAPGPDGVRRSRFGVIRNCYDDQTEILTEKRGWQLFADLLPDDAVATLHDGERLKFEVPSSHYAAPYQGEMIGLENEGIDLLVTPEHKLWVTKTSGRKRRRTPYRFEVAEECYGMINWRMKRDAEWVGGTDRFTLDFYEFLGLWFADGYAGSYHYEGRSAPVRRFGITQKRHLAYAKDLIERAGLSFTEKARDHGPNWLNISVTEPWIRAIAEELAGNGLSPERRLPAWLKEATPEALRRFLFGYFTGDGKIRRHAKESSRAATSSKQLADDIQEIALRAGEVINLTSFEHKEPQFEGAQSIQYFMTLLTHKKHAPKTKHGWHKKEYDGIVYCVTVSTHIVYVRRNGKAVWCSQTLKQLEDTTERSFLQWFPAYTYGDWTPSKHNYTIKALRGQGDDRNAEIEVMFRALDRPDQIGDLLSTEFTGAWIHEGREVPWPIIDAVTGRVGRYPAMRDGGATWSGVWSDTNPPDADSDWYKFFEEMDHSEAVEELAKFIPGMTVEKYCAIFKQPSGLSPRAENLANLQPGYYQRLAIGKSPEWLKVFVEGKYGFTTDGKAVWPEYNDQLHCPTDKDKQPKVNINLPIVRSWDFGLTPACVFSQVTARGQWIVVDELIATSMGATAFSEAVIEHSARYYSRAEFWDVGDPAGMQRSQTDETTCFQILRNKGIEIEPAMQSLEIRLESVRKPLRTLVDGRPQFVLHPRCSKLRRAMLGGYHFRRMRISGERYTTSPEKDQFSHVADALGYAGTRLFGAGIITQSDGQRQRETENAGMGRSRSTGY